MHSRKENSQFAFRSDKDQLGRAAGARALADPVKGVLIGLARLGVGWLARLRVVGFCVGGVKAQRAAEEQGRDQAGADERTGGVSEHACAPIVQMNSRIGASVPQLWLVIIDGFCGMTDFRLSAAPALILEDLVEQAAQMSSAGAALSCIHTRGLRELVGQIQGGENGDA